MSNKKQFEYIDQKIKQAAENFQPGYEDAAWQKMAALLDKEEKRRPVFWIWPLLGILFLAVAGSFYFFNSSKKTTAHSNSSVIEIENRKTENNKTVVTTSTVTSNHSSLPQSGNAENNLQPSNKLERPLISKKNKKYAAKKSVLITAAELSDEENIEKVLVKDVLPEDKKNATALKETSSIETISNDENPIAAVKDSVEVVNEIVAFKKNDSTIITIKAKEEKKLNKKRNKFYLLAALGPDAGSMNMLSFNNSTLALKYGVGIGYQLSKKVSIQTGIYVGMKKYIAGPGDYHPKDNSYWNSVQITKVNANCMIYEIPLTIKYNWLQKTTNSFYVALGVSSYIMKQEDYNYYYYRNNIYYEKDWTYWGNKHLFAVFNFSAGWEKEISNKFSLLVEPSISIPLSGVGDGSVKMYSSSLLLGLKYKFKTKH